LACLIYCPGLPEAERAHFNTPLMQFSERALAVREVIAGADLVVCGGTHNILCAALLAGKPVLAVPRLAEQEMHSGSVQALGAGLIVLPGQEARIGGMLTRLLSEKSFTHAAGAFADRHADRPQERTIREVVERCLQLIA
jgi:UDP:flavonoid glycosyltransferase YjiC (YdhE family)